jgi:hypothetical protein
MPKLAALFDRTTVLHDAEGWRFEKKEKSASVLLTGRQK